MPFVFLASVAIAIGATIAMVELFLTKWTFVGVVAQAPSNGRRRATTIPCNRCAPHQRCYAVAWCDPCGEWMCMQCWFDCTVAADAHGGAPPHLSGESRAMARAAGPQADGTYVLFSGGDWYAHEDGGRLSA